ncbi:hypothetical protein NM208_g12874 [Fusarium decemcellulare]|uniref:Uncharacterized protein n=1 Tax=Fusarium decemcellulare TaxID=57161 RepID=A0ACC1RLX6_9HYPO|nr:hypothetical protein NM208_g12874 [Fusarium decemcellulare]
MSFASLPTELFTTISEFCDRQQLASLARVNHSFHGLFNAVLYQCNIRGEDSRASCVRWAATRGSLSTLKLALAYGADINSNGKAPDESWTSGRDYAAPLHLAIKNDFQDMVVWLLDHGARLDVEAYRLCFCSKRRPYVNPLPLWYPLHFAVCHSSEPMLSLLLQRGAYYSAELRLGLYCAVEHGMLSAVDMFLQHPDMVRLYQDPSRVSALHYVVHCEDTPVACQSVHRLVDHGVPIDAICEGRTALLALVAKQRFKPAIALLERGADASLDVEPQFWAGMVDLCLNQDYTIKMEEAEQEGQASVAEELKQDRRKLLSLLIARGVDVNRPLIGSQSTTRPLFSALRQGRDLECLKMLLDAGASIKDAARLHSEPMSEKLIAGFFLTFEWYSYDEDTPPEDTPPRDIPAYENLEMYKPLLCFLLEKGARVDSVGGEDSALDKCCGDDPPLRGNEVLEFLAEHATLMSVSVEFVEGLMGRWREKEDVYALLQQLHGKLVKESLC